MSTVKTRAIIGVTLGSLVGMLMVAVIVNRGMDSWMGTHPPIARTYQFVHMPAWIVVGVWHRLGLPHPSKEFGWMELFPYAVMAQWALLGLVAGLVWNRRSRQGQNTMSRLATEVVLFVGGITAVVVALLSDEMFNSGIILPIGTLLLAGAFLFGLTCTPFAREKPIWRNLLTFSELIGIALAVLFLSGVICL